MLEIQQLRLNLESYLILLAATALPAALLWLVYIRPRPLLPPQRHRYVAWSGFEVFLVFFFVLLFWPAVIKDPLDAALAKLSDDRRVLWMTVLAWPIQIATVLVLLHGLIRDRAYQLGLSIHNLARNLLLGWVGWALFAPVVLCCHIATEWFFRTAWGDTPEEHPLLRIFEASPLRLEWILIIVSATILAPVLEELLFRGVLQPWFASRPWGGTVALLAALSSPFLLRGHKLVEAWHRKDHAGFLHESTPVVFAGLMIAACYAFERAATKWGARPQEFRAIYGTALLFAMFHVSVWPTPIPLFLLALALGYLAYRTQSVVGPIVMHVLFNTIACIAVFLA
ncbi:MAG TPA: CPBP family intramembrane glutamic endopeptidase [Gemmataceae bacterium]|nr:CPBP family intramembrane glutamic endopeptidase [Gemmataceae bacterium]